MNKKAVLGISIIVGDLMMAALHWLGKNYEMVLNIALNLPDFNNTTPDTVDLSGKQVKTIQPKDIEQFCHPG